MRRILVLAPLLLAACDQSIHFRSVQVDGLPRCAEPEGRYARPLCVEHEGGEGEGTRVVTGPELALDLPDRAGEWTFRVGRCEHPWDPSRASYRCGECRELGAAITRRVEAGEGRRVRLEAPPTECVDR